MTSLGRQKRVMLWAVPRSLSTAMCRVMMNSGLRTEVVFEPYGVPFERGPERLSPDYAHLEVIPDMTYANAKKIQEMPYEDKEFVFVKNMPRHLGSQRVTAEWIPDGYVHSFIIRHPRSTIFSKLDVLKRMDNNGKANTLYEPSAAGYKQQVEMSRVLRRLGHNIVVLDADDLLDNPEAALRAYCGAVGLVFHQSMLDWEPLSESEYQRVINCAGYQDLEWFNVMKNSSGIHRRRRPPASLQDCEIDDVTSDPETRDLARRTEQEVTKYFEELYALRLRV